MAINDLEGQQWRGQSKLWLEPGAPVRESEATAHVKGGTLYYTWSFEGKAQQGVLKPDEEGSARWRDTWHQPADTECTALPAFGARLCAVCSYPAPPGPDWHWRIGLAERPDGALVLQMTNITCWGEEAPAVLMTFTRDS